MLSKWWISNSKWTGNSTLLSLNSHHHVTIKFQSSDFNFKFNLIQQNNILKNWNAFYIYTDRVYIILNTSSSPFPLSSCIQWIQNILKHWRCWSSIWCFTFISSSLCCNFLSHTCMYSILSINLVSFCMEGLNKLMTMHLSSIQDNTFAVMMLYIWCQSMCFNPFLKNFGVLTTLQLLIAQLCCTFAIHKTCKKKN